MTYVITAKKIYKTFEVKEKRTSSGLWAVIGDLLSPILGTFTAIENCSFRVQKGEKLALIGPPGSGKTTLLQMLCGSLSPSKGEVKVLGHAPDFSHKALSSKIGVFLQGAGNLWPHLPIQESLALLSTLHHIPSELYEYRLESLTQQLSLASILKKKPSSLTPGERIRAEWAACLLHKPEIILWDDPLPSLPFAEKQLLLNIMEKTLSTHPCTFVLATSSLQDAQRLCSHVVILDKGKVLLDAPIKELQPLLAEKKKISLRLQKEKKPEEYPNMTFSNNSPLPLSCTVDLQATSLQEAVGRVLHHTPCEELRVENLSLADLIARLHRKKNHV